MASPLGIVVVGVGIAGRVRIRDFINAVKMEEDNPIPDVKFIGFVSRREIEIEGATRLKNLEEALGRDDVHAVLVCTENEKHEEIARKVLEAGKHVCVEFPIALTADKAKGLFKLAEDKKVVCYEEDISLLSPSHKKAKELIQATGLKQIDKALKGRPNGWIEDIAKSGSPFTSGVAMLHRVIDLAGDVTPQTAIIKIDPENNKKIKALGKLTNKDNVPVNLIYERDPGIERRQAVLKYTLKDDTVLTDRSLQAMIPMDDPDIRSIGLFMQDTMQFVATVQGKRSNAESQKLTIRALEIADELFRLAKENKESIGF